MIINQTVNVLHHSYTYVPVRYVKHTSGVGWGLDHDYIKLGAFPL